MNTKKNSPFLKGVPSALRALLLAVGTTVILIVLSEIIGAIFPKIENISESVGYILYDIIIAIGCYFICKQNPKSVWYVPIIANVFVIISAIAEPNFWITDLWMYFGSSIVLSIPASLFGAFMGGNKQSLQN